jgi:hypothetical protein
MAAKRTLPGFTAHLTLSETVNPYRLTGIAIQAAELFVPMTTIPQFPTARMCMQYCNICERRPSSDFCQACDYCKSLGK